MNRTLPGSKGEAAVARKRGLSNVSRFARAHRAIFIRVKRVGVGAAATSGNAWLRAHENKRARVGLFSSDKCCRPSSLLHATINYIALFGFCFFLIVSYGRVSNIIASNFFSFSRLSWFSQWKPESPLGHAHIPLDRSLKFLSLRVRSKYARASSQAKIILSASVCLELSIELKNFSSLL